VETLAVNRCFGGRQGVYRHDSKATGTPMTFAVYIPPQAETGPVPCLWYLSGLTCTHENAMTKAGLQQIAAEEGLALVFPDTSPRGEGVADDAAFDMGQGAGFYVDATETPWAAHFRMESYVTQELRGVVEAMVPVSHHGVTGHSMGGHGALTLAMRHPDLFDSLSAFSPITNPTESEWGRKQLGGYLGPDRTVWADHDASLLLTARGWKADILVDQGVDDPFYDHLRPFALADAMARTRTPGVVRLHRGYDHSYFFVASVAGDHVRWHAERLRGGPA